MNHRFKCKIRKLLDENFQGLGLSEEVLSITPKAGSRILKNDKCDFISIKNFFSVKVLAKGEKSYRLGESICKPRA